MSDVTTSQWTLPVAPSGRRASGWYGVLLTIATEGSLFAYFLFSYFYLLAQTHNTWPPGGAPKLMVAAPNTVILIASSIAVGWGERSLRSRNDTRRLGIGLAVGIVLGIVFVGLQLLEWHNKAYGPRSDAYGSLYFTITGFHMAHVVVGLIILIMLWLWNRMGYFSAARPLRVSVGAVYWHFVDAVWLFVFTTFYISPYLM